VSGPFGGHEEPPIVGVHRIRVERQNAPGLNALKAQDALVIEVAWMIGQAIEADL